jgi:hypothetical protein
VRTLMRSRATPPPSSTSQVSRGALRLQHAEAGLSHRGDSEASRSSSGRHDAGGGSLPIGAQRVAHQRLFLVDERGGRAHEIQVADEVQRVALRARQPLEIAGLGEAGPEPLVAVRAAAGTAAASTSAPASPGAPPCRGR